MRQHGEEHRRDAAEHHPAVGLGQLELKRWVEVRHQHVRRERLHGPEGEHPAAGDVEERHRVDADVAGAGAERELCEAGVVRQPAVVQDGALGTAGCPRCVEDLRGIVGIDDRQRAARVAGRAEALPIGEGHRLPQPGQAVPQLRDGRSHRVAAVLVDQEEPVRAGMLEHVPELGGGVRGVDGDERQPGQRRAELEQHPLGNVVRPDGHALARL